MTDQERAFEMEIDIDAPADEVWRALSDAEELTRWFPLEASVQPGRGGTMTWTWEQPWMTRIDRWDPPRRLRLIQADEQPLDVDGRPIETGRAVPARIGIEFTLETMHGKTRLRLVHSGFGPGAEWDDEVEGISLGWQFELRSLRHYLQRHHGRDRHVGWARASSPLSIDDTWARLVGPDGFSVGGATAGQPYQLDTPTADHFSGTTELAIPRREFFGTVRELDDGVFRVSSYPAAGQVGVTVWAATYSAGLAARVADFGPRAREVLDRLFPARVPANR